MKTKISFGLFLLFVAFGCNQKITTINSLQYQFKNGSWNKFEEIVWDSIIFVGNKPLNLTFEADIDAQFKAETISFQLIVEGDDGEMRNQGFELPLSNFTTRDEKNGKKTISILLPQAGQFIIGNPYRIEFVSLMPLLQTDGIYQISLEFKE